MAAARPDGDGDSRARGVTASVSSATPAPDGTRGEGDAARPRHIDSHRPRARRTPNRTPATKFKKVPTENRRIPGGPDGKVAPFPVLKSDPSPLPSLPFLASFRPLPSLSSSTRPPLPPMVLMAAAAADHDRHRTAKPSSPPEDSPAPEPTPPSSRTRLHGFSFPTLSWGTHRLLRCSKNPDTSPPSAAPDTPSQDKEKAHRSTGGGGGSPQRPPQRPWNLRTRRSATAAPLPARSDDAAEEAAEHARPEPTGTKKRAFYIVLSKEEIALDFAAIRGTRPPRRPKKRPRAVQRQLDLLYPGLCLADVTPDSYKIEER